LLSAVVAVTVSGQEKAAPPAATQATGQLSADDAKAGWKLLFDGKTLNGWRGYKKTDASGSRWIVEDGMLTLPKNDGKDTRGARDLISADTYDQFELAWDWRVASGGNSGLKYFVLEDLDSAIGHEYQLIDDERHPDAKIGAKRQTASLYDVLPAADRPLRPAGEWNSSRVVVRGSSVEHWLNGTKVLSYELNSPALKTAIAASKFKDVARFGTPQKGHILIQDHGDQVWYRGVRIRAITGGSH
jgi:hypothetical protein